MITFFRAIKFAFQDMGRNLSLSLMTVFILVLMLLSMNTLLIIRTLTTEATSSIKDQLDISIYFREETTDEQVEEVRKYLETFPEVVELTVKSRDEVLSEFQANYEGNKDVLDALAELDENPLGATIIVKTKDPIDYEKIIASLTVPEYKNIIVDKPFEDSKTAISRIDIITKQVERFTIALSAFFAFIAFLIIFNTIRVSIFTQRVEINIKKLVGATNWFIRSPYVISAFIFNLVSVGIATAIVYYSVGFLDPYTSVIFGSSNILTNYYNSHILMLLGIQFVGVLLLTSTTSWLAMRRHLRV